MKVLIINGSPRVGGNSSILIKNLVETFNRLEVETEVIDIANRDIRGCIACGYCSIHEGRCVFNDEVNETKAKLATSTGLIVVSPVYYASPNGTVISFLDRLFHSGHLDL